LARATTPTEKEQHALADLFLSLAETLEEKVLSEFTALFPPPRKQSLLSSPLLSAKIDEPTPTAKNQDSATKLSSTEPDAARF
jgi:hypothetical protein